MAVGWLTVLKWVPWTDVIKNAPKVADGAKKLWQTAGYKTQPPVEATGSGVPLSPQAQALAGLQARLQTLENATQDLHEQMLVSSELIKALAEQNTQLIRRAEVNRVRLLALASVTAVVAVVAVIAVIGLTRLLAGA